MQIKSKVRRVIVKLSDSQVSTNLIDPELSGINQITEIDQTSFDEIMTESKGSYNDALEFMVNSGLFREEALGTVERWMKMIVMSTMLIYHQATVKQERLIKRLLI